MRRALGDGQSVHHHGWHQALLAATIALAVVAVVAWGHRHGLGRY